MQHCGDIEEVDDEAVDYVIQQVDINQDGKIDLMEFLQMMLNRFKEEKKQLREFQNTIANL